MTKCRSCSGTDVSKNQSPLPNGGKYIEYDCQECGDFWTRDIPVYRKADKVCGLLEQDIEEGIQGDLGFSNYTEHNHVELYPS